MPNLHNKIILNYSRNILNTPSKPHSIICTNPRMHNNIKTECQTPRSLGLPNTTKTQESTLVDNKIS